MLYDLFVMTVLRLDSVIFATVHDHTLVFVAACILLHWGCTAFWRLKQTSDPSSELFGEDSDTPILPCCKTDIIAPAPSSPIPAEDFSSSEIHTTRHAGRGRYKRKWGTGELRNGGLGLNILPPLIESAIIEV